MLTIKKKFPLFVVFVLALSACDTLPTAGDSAAVLAASGVVETVEVSVAPELGGRVAEVFVDEGDEVKAGDALFRLEDDLLVAQRAQAAAAHDSALAGLETSQASLAAAETARNSAELNVEAANVQYEQIFNAARIANQPTRSTAWSGDLPDEFDLPVWYFNQSEEIKAAQAEVDAASEALEVERANLQDVIENANNDDLVGAETRLAEAQTGFLIVQELLDRKIDQNHEEAVSDYIQNLYDSAKAELETAQLAYDQMLSDQAFADVIEARARVAVARERYELALDELNALLAGEDSLSVEAAGVMVRQAEAAVTQAEANVSLAKASVLQAETLVAEAQAALDLLDVQIAKLTVQAAVSGVVMVRNVQPGEILAPGVSVLTIGRLDELTVTVYLPENQYGQVGLDDRATIAADSFPGQSFDAVVTRIADQAEYTPRNVQTQEERQTTVYAVELAVINGEGRLKPGMPVDVRFSAP